MKRLLLIIFILFISLSIFAIERGLTITPLPLPEKGLTGRAKIYQPEAITANPQTGLRIDRDTWEAVDSIHVDCYIPAAGFIGTKFDATSVSLEKITNISTIIELSEIAIAKSPIWIRTALANTLCQLSEENQTKWAGVICDANDPYIDEIAFSVANCSVQYLESDNAYTELFTENAWLIYEIDNDLSYVDVIDYGNSFNDENYYSTTRYWKRDAEGNLSQQEVPRDIYYWYIVHPKLTDEIPAYIDPSTLESNSTHTNNITDPESGYFWRDYLYNHNDDGYPKLKYYLQNCEIAWNGQNLNTESAIGAMSSWLSQSLSFTSNSERPHQPVRIYDKHIGRCGEHADMRAAIARIGLIPATSILSISGDHTWNHFWDEQWIHWDSPDVNNPLLYENGWGKVFGSVFEIKSNGFLTAVTDMYSEGWATLEIYVLDDEGSPVDGARVILCTSSSNTTDNISITNSEGKCEFIVGDNRSYSFYVSSPVGNCSYQQIVDNTVDGETYTYSVNLLGTLPGLDYETITVPADYTDDYKIAAEFTLEKDVIYGTIPMDDTDNTFLCEATDGGMINFFMTDNTNFDQYQAGESFSTFNQLIDAETGSIDFDIPADDSWTAFWDNSTNSRNPQHVSGWVTLYSYDETGGMATISGTISDAVSGENISAVTITAGVYETTSDAEGNYSLSIYPNDYEINISKSGYADYSIAISVENGDNETQNVEMQELIYAPNNILAEILLTSQAHISWQQPTRMSNTRENQTRELLGYDVYRFLEGEENNLAQWELIAEEVSTSYYEDAAWINLPEGIYRYGVGASYSDGNDSARNISNRVYKDKFVSVNVDIYTNSSDSADGAIVKLSNQECPNSIYSYTSETVDESVTFAEVFKGTYTLQVSMSNFEDYIEDDIEIVDVSSLIALLNEIIYQVQGIAVIDHIAYWEPVPADQANRAFQNYKLFVDDMGNSIATTESHQYDLSGYGDDTHVVGISAVFTTGESTISNLEFNQGSSFESDLVANYHLDGSADDASENAHNGEIIGDITFADAGISGSCAEFDESAEYISAATVFTEAPEAFTLSWWILPDNAFNWNQQIRAAIGWDGFNFHTTNEGTIYTGTNTGTRFAPNTCSEGITVDEWQHFVYSYGNGMSALYKNGEKIASRENTAAPIAWGGFQIGHSNENTISGKVDEVVLWERALGTTETQHIFTSNFPYWGVLEGTVTNLADNTPVESAVLSIGMFSAVTDAAGHYSIDLAACSYSKLTCVVDNFDAEMVESIIISDGETTIIDFEYGFTGATSDAVIPNTNILFTNYPNPFNPSTTISYSLSDAQNVELAIYNIKGQLVNTLVNEIRPAGKSSIIWEGFDGNRKPVASGIYFYKLQTKNYSDIKRMILLK